MSGQNQFLPFAAGAGANVLTPAEYQALAALSQGFQSGIASSKNVNTPLRQSTFVAAAIAQLIANNDMNASDDGDLAGFVAKLSSAIRSVSNAPGLIGFFSQTSAPSGWLKANGAVVSRTTYASLFSAIGTTFGVGDGSTTFKLPDLRGEFLRGLDDGRGVDAGRSLGSFQNDEFKSHFHYLSSRVAASGGQIEVAGGLEIGGWGQTSAVGGVETRPRNIAFLACIKY